MTSPISVPVQTLSIDEVVRCRLCYKKIFSSAKLSAVSQVFAGKENSAILGGNECDKVWGGFSTWAAKPKEVFEFNTEQEDVFGKLAQALNKFEPEGSCRGELPRGIFSCGWIGYFGYELGRHIEKLPQSAVDDFDMPLIRLCFYDRAICYDHSAKAWYLIALAMPGEAESGEDKLKELGELLKEAEGILTNRPRAGDLANVDVTKIRCNMSRAYYFEAIERIKEYIYDGDVYQINFSQRFECDYIAAAIDLYHWQNEYNPSPYAAYIGCDDFAIVSASPEMFITVEDGFIRTTPIKGTRPRVSSGADREEINKRNFAKLAASEKEQA